MTRPVLPYMIIHCRRYIRNISLVYKYRVYNNLFSILLNISFSNVVPSAKHEYNHMVGRAASFVSPFYSILLDRGASITIRVLPTKNIKVRVRFGF